MILGLALIESLVIYAFVIAIMIVVKIPDVETYFQMVTKACLSGHQTAEQRRKGRFGGLLRFNPLLHHERMTDSTPTAKRRSPPGIRAMVLLGLALLLAWQAGWQPSSSWRPPMHKQKSNCCGNIAPVRCPRLRLGTL